MANSSIIDRKELAKKLISLRKEHKYTRQYIANMISKSLGAYRRYENATSTLDFIVLGKLCELYKTTPNDLLEFNL